MILTICLDDFSFQFFVFFVRPPVSNACTIIIIIIEWKCTCIVPVAFACLTLANLTIRFGKVRIHEMLSFQRPEKADDSFIMCLCGDLLV